VDKKQVSSFLKQIIGAYTTFEPTPERVEIWQRHLEDIDYDLAVKRLDKHILTSKFPPTVAEIVNPDEAAKRRQKADPDTLSPAALMQGGYITVSG